ncbi:G-box-binding factor 4 isoform X2 [Arachis hypogaea]|uniref:G-box-binding factor 4 isoform X2 n=1 Tax=Arachis hypogaea TaxID=3818 RepID=UPI000DED256C|nr:G-box-binding factor 4 isoform X2 [Arachis hypogaea]
MASSKLMPSTNSRNPDPPLPLQRQPSTSPKPQQFTTTNFIPMPEDATLLDAQISLFEAPSPAPASAKTVDDLWREIVAGERRECKEEAPEEMMTLEDFLAKAGAVDDVTDVVPIDEEVKMPMALTDRLGSGGGMFAFDPLPTTPFQGMENMEGSVIGFGNGVEVVEGGVGGGGGGGRGKRGRPVLEQQLDKAAQQRQRRMIKNRESAARSRERKQAYQVELESLAVKLEEENDKLMKEKLMEKVIPVVEKRRPPRFLRRVRSLQW